jgi:hypothetical protein
MALTPNSLARGSQGFKSPHLHPTNALVTGLAGHLRRAGDVPGLPSRQQMGSNCLRNGWQTLGLPAQPIRDSWQGRLSHGDPHQPWVRGLGLYIRLVPRPVGRGDSLATCGHLERSETASARLSIVCPSAADPEQPGQGLRSIRSRTPSVLRSLHDKDQSGRHGKPIIGSTPQPSTSKDAPAGSLPRPAAKGLQVAGRHYVIRAARSRPVPVDAEGMLVAQTARMTPVEPDDVGCHFQPSVRPPQSPPSLASREGGAAAQGGYSRIRRTSILRSIISVLTGAQSRAQGWLFVLRVVLVVLVVVEVLVAEVLEGGHGSSLTPSVINRSVEGARITSLSCAS